MVQPSDQSAEPALDPASLFAAATEQTGGLTEIEDPGFHDRLAILATLLDESRMTSDGRRVAFEVVSDLIATRLRLAEDRRQHPGISEERIERPLLATGLARSGTTVLHSLLAEDPASRAPLQWEVRFPSPPPSLASPDDPRIDVSNREREEYHRMVPGLLQAHPYGDDGAMALTECEGLFAIDLRNTLPHAYWRVPAPLTARPLTTDFMGTYAFHRYFLQQLQWGGPPRRWALKGTEHHYHLDEVLATYPDGIVVWIHRDPARVLPSMLELISILQEGTTGRPVRRPRLGRFVLDTIEANLTKVVESTAVDDERVCHVLYRDLMADPPAAIRKIYGRYDLPFSDEYAELLRTWSDRNAPDRHGRFQYDAADFELDRDELHRRFAPYRELFGIPTE